MSEPKPKSFEISKRAVWEAYRRVKANKGGAGVDGESMAEFEVDLKDNLYKLWNRLSSGSYFPPPVRAVEIPKRDGSSRTLGVPTVADRIAQTVVRGYLEPSVEPVFHEDSYGYRPGRSAHQALRVCRERCWRADWVLDLDIRSFFDSVPWELVLKAVAHHTDLRWVLLYVERRGQHRRRRAGADHRHHRINGVHGAAAIPRCSCARRKGMGGLSWTEGRAEATSWWRRRPGVSSRRCRPGVATRTRQPMFPLNSDMHVWYRNSDSVV